jgi:SMI1 / KNR4 family (SUKH-1)
MNEGAAGATKEAMSSNEVPAGMSASAATGAHGSPGAQGAHGGEEPQEPQDATASHATGSQPIPAAPAEELSAETSAAMPSISARSISAPSIPAPSIPGLGPAGEPVPMEELRAEGSSTSLPAVTLPAAARIGSRAASAPLPTADALVPGSSSSGVTAGAAAASPRTAPLSRGTPAASFSPLHRDRAALWSPVRDVLRDLSSSDLRRLRFGANRHRYHQRAPISEARLIALEATAGISLPEDYRDYLLEMGDGGVGPYYGLVPFDQPAQQDLASGRFTPPTQEHEGPWYGTVLLCHLGCGYLVYLVVEGQHKGEVWLDLGSSGPPAKIAPHFIAFYTEWLTALQRAEWPAVHVRPGSCALALALSAYLGHVERQLGKLEGALSEVELRAALTSLGPGSIHIAAETKSFPPLASLAAGEQTVDPCLACERMLQELSGLGLRRDVVAAGVTVGFPDLPEY